MTVTCEMCGREFQRWVELQTCTMETPIGPQMIAVCKDRQACKGRITEQMVREAIQNLEGE